LGIQEKPNQKAVLGTMVHKALECLALGKQALQNNKDYFEDDVAGVVNIDYDTLHDTKFVHHITDVCFEHYKKSHKQFFNFTNSHLIKCHSMVQSVLHNHNGSFDPRRRDIVQPEIQFEITFDEPWASYEFIDPRTYQKITGQLGIKGTIDLVTKINDNMYEVIDWKTGKRIDWGTGEEKTYEKLSQDPQLHMYHYALSKTFPNIDHFAMTIHYIADGGPFTMSYDRENLNHTIEIIKKRFLKIKNTTRPALKSTKKWFCSKICHYGKTYHPKNPDKTICKYIHDKIISDGIEKTIREETEDGFSISHYQNPGE
jgi:hypothetical protein